MGKFWSIVFGVVMGSLYFGIATANLYPRISLVGALGYEAQNFSDLFASKSFIGTIGPSVRWDVLNYGRLVNGIRVQDAFLQTAAVDYQNLVLQAGREVEDGIVLFLRRQERAGGQAAKSVRSGSRSPRSTASSTSTHAIPRDSASTRA